MSAPLQYVMLALIVMTSVKAGTDARNAREAHRHIHELACAVGAVDLCKFHEETEK